mgnify:CR=1 FL=1
MDKQLINTIIDQFRIDPYGIHGVSHWASVRVNGLKLAKLNGADPLIIEYFAFLHDSQRCNDHNDPKHGYRASEWISSLDLPLSDIQLVKLKIACENHTSADPSNDLTEDVTILTCWDADRKDLTRLGIKPDPSRLYTKEAKMHYHETIKQSKVGI